MVVNSNRYPIWCRKVVVHVTILQVAVAVGWVKGFLYPKVFQPTVVLHYTFDPWCQPGWEKETLIINIPHLFGICLNLYPRILVSWSHWYASRTSKVIGGLWYNISRNPTRTMSSRNVSMTRDITYKFCMYDHVSSFQRRPVSRAATVSASYWPPCLNIVVVVRIHTPV